MKKTAEEILKEVIADRFQNVPHVHLTDFAKGFGTHYDVALKAIEIYHNQSHPTPTEAEINEAAEKYAEGIMVNVLSTNPSRSKIYDCAKADFKFGAQWQSSQPNPAIAVIEAKVAKLKESLPNYPVPSNTGIRIQINTLNWVLKLMK